jgi:hypothetical protein
MNNSKQKKNNCLNPLYYIHFKETNSLSAKRKLNEQSSFFNINTFIYIWTNSHMKMHEINETQLDELDSDGVGRTLGKAAKSVGKGIADFGKGFKAGFTGKNRNTTTSNRSDATPRRRTRPTPAGTPPPETTPTPAGTPPANSRNATQTDTFAKAKSDIRKVQGGQKPMPHNTAVVIRRALTQLSKGSKEHGVWAAEKIIRFASAGIDVNREKQSWIANAKAGERFLTQSRYYELTKMLRENNLRWSDLGLRIHLVESTNKLVGISRV